MKRPLPAMPEFISTALAKLLAAQDSKSVTITLKEYMELDFINHQVVLEGEFETEDSNIPTAYTVTPREEVVMNRRLGLGPKPHIYHAGNGVWRCVLGAFFTTGYSPYAAYYAMKSMLKPGALK